MAKVQNIGCKVSPLNEGGEESLLELYFMDVIKNDVNWFTGEEESMLGCIINKVNDTKPTVIRQCIDSWGGSAPVGLGVYNYLKSKESHKAMRVETKILNNCASIATVMASAGDIGYITMPRNGIMVVHKASGSASGTADELREAANVIDVYTENVLDVYVKNNRKGKTRDDLFNLIKDGDYWMTGTQAKEMGFVDDVYNDESITITNSIKIAQENYGVVPNHILALVEDGEATKNKNFLTNIVNTIKMEVKAMMECFKSEIKNSAVPVEVQNNIFNVLEKPLEGILNLINTSISQEREAATTEVNNKVTEVTNGFTETIKNLTEGIKAINDKMGENDEIIASQKNVIDEQTKIINNLKSDVRKLQGKPTPASGSEEVENAIGDKGIKTFAGRMKFQGGETE